VLYILKRYDSSVVVMMTVVGNLCVVYVQEVVIILGSSIRESIAAVVVVVEVDGSDGVKVARVVLMEESGGADGRGGRGGKRLYIICFNRGAPCNTNSHLPWVSGVYTQHLLQLGYNSLQLMYLVRSLGGGCGSGAGGGVCAITNSDDYNRWPV
jgi:hypothetical protein